jgi:ribosome-binding factor A
MPVGPVEKTLYAIISSMKKNIQEKSQRQRKVSELLREIASKMISRETNRTSLITVTSVDISPDLKQCTIFVSIFPESAQESGLNFLKRKRRDLKMEVRQNCNLRNIPFFDFDLDAGEKNRQLIEEIALKDKQ